MAVSAKRVLAWPSRFAVLSHPFHRFALPNYDREPLVLCQKVLGRRLRVVENLSRLPNTSDAKFRSILGQERRRGGLRSRPSRCATGIDGGVLSDVTHRTAIWWWRRPDVQAPVGQPALH
jgi:hypothetical protein